MTHSVADSALAERLTRSAKRRPPHIWLITGLTVLYIVLVCLGVGRLLWYDELFTYYISTQPTIHQLFVAIVNWDQNPPALYLLTRISVAMFGDNAVAVRLPSIVEFYLASVALFLYMRRKTGAAYAAVPVLILFCNPAFFRYATEARPYALLAMFFSILLLCWDTATSATEHRALALWGMALANIGMFSSHVFAMISLGPFLAAELMRFVRRRKPDYPVWAVLLFPMLCVFAYRPLFGLYSQTVFPAGFQAGPWKFAAFFWHTFAPVGLAVIVSAIAAWIASRRRLGTYRVRRFRLLDLVFLGVLVFVNTSLLNIVLMLGHRAFWDRYCLTSVLGLYLLAGLLLAWWLRFNVYAGWTLTAVLAAFILVQRIAIPAYKISAKKPPTNSAILTKLRPDLPLVPASGVTFFEMNHNDLPEIVSRVHYLVDTQAAVEFAHATIFDRFEKLKDFFPMRARVEQYRDFVRTHREFLVVGSTWWPEDWLLKKLAVDGAQIENLGDYQIPYLETTLFDVKMPAVQAHETGSSSSGHPKTSGKS